MNAPMPKILVVEDEAIIALDITQSLQRLGYAIAGTATTGPDAIRKAEALRPDLVLMDVRLKGEMDGIDAAEQIWTRLGLPVVFLTAYADSNTLRRAKGSEPFGYVLKPFEENDLHTAIQIALHKHSAEEARRRHSSRALAESEERFQILVEGVKDHALYLLDPDGKIATWSLGATRMTGYSERDIIGQPFARLHTASDIAEEKPQRMLDRAAQAGRSETECTQLRRDGSVFWAEVSISALLGDGGVIRGFACVARDVTERKKAADALREAEQRFRTLADSAPVMIWMSEPDGQCNYLNHPWIEFTGRTAEHQYGTGWSKSVFPDDLDACMTTYLAAVKKREAFKMEYRLRRADGAYRWVLVHGIPLYTPDREFIGYIGSCIDIHERKLMEVSERGARADAEKVNQMKDEFLATLSHELRTPLTPILGWTHVLKNAKLGSDELKRGLESIERNARTQKKLVEDLLDVSRIIAGKLTLDLTAVALPQTIESAMDAVRGAADANGIKLQFKKHNPVGPIMGDTARLQQIVWNLLTNAIKFSPPNGTIEIHLSQKGPDAEIRIVDQGEGFEPSFAGKIFEMFSQADSSSTRKYGGLGLGLAIVRHLVKTHGGTVSAHSAGAGRGATFTVLLPLPAEGSMAGQLTTKRPSGEMVMTEEELLKGRDILIVDDDRDTREFMQFALHRYGAACRAAGSVDEALVLIKARRPHFVISDLGMPGKDGYALLKQVRQDYPGMPVVALSAYAREEDRARALQEGFTRYFAKPIPPLELATALAKIGK